MRMSFNRIRACSLLVVTINKRYNQWTDGGLGSCLRNIALRQVESV